MSRNEVLEKQFAEPDVIALLEDSIHSLELLERALDEVNANFSLRRERGGAADPHVLPVVFSLAEHRGGRIPQGLDLAVALAEKTQTIQEPIPEWTMVAPFCTAVIQAGRLPEMVDYLRLSGSQSTHALLTPLLDKLENIGLQMAKAESCDHQRWLDGLEIKIVAATEQIKNLFNSAEFNDVIPGNCPDLVANLGVLVCPALEILRHTSALVVALDKILVAAVCPPENPVLHRLPIPLLRPDGTVDVFELQMTPEVLQFPAQPLTMWLEAAMRIRRALDGLRAHTRAVELDPANRRQYEAALRPANISVFGSHPELLQQTVTRLMETATGNPAMERCLLNLFCTPVCVHSTGGERMHVPIADYPSNLPILQWMMPLLVSRDDVDTTNLDRAMQGCDYQLLSLINFCKDSIRSGNYAALAGRLTSEIDKAMGAGVLEVRKAAFVLLLDCLIKNDEVRRTLKNLIPRVGDLRKMVANTRSLAPVPQIQSALDRVTMGLTPNLEDYFGQNALKERVQRMISGFLHVAEDTTRLRGRKPCEVVKNGLLLPGPPGGGKTFFMDCLVNTLGLQCFTVSPEKTTAPESTAAGLLTQENLVDLLEKTIHEAGSYIRSHNKPCILKLDEFEQFCLDRRQFKDHFEQTNRALTLIEQLRTNPRIFLLAATNHLDFVDEAMRRVGRFDVVRSIGLPDAESARQIIAGSIFPYPEISLTPGQYDELADIAAKGQLIPLSIIQTLAADLMVTGRPPTFEELKAAMLETVEDRRMSSGIEKPEAA